MLSVFVAVVPLAGALVAWQETPTARPHGTLMADASDHMHQGLACRLVHVDQALSDADAAIHARRYGHGAYPIVVDRAHTLVRIAGVTTTPEVVVADDAGGVRYRGGLTTSSPVGVSLAARCAITPCAMRRDVATGTPGTSTTHHSHRVLHPAPAAASARMIEPEAPDGRQPFMPRILVIDDDRELTAMLADYLSPEGFIVDAAHSGDDGLAQALANDYALIILDLMLPVLSGLDVLRGLRVQSTCPVIMLTARGQEIDRIVGLEVGADDYLSKPFSARELLARMHAVLRRARPAETGRPDVLAVGDVVLDAAARTVRRDGEVVPLTSLEFDLLRMLLAAAGDVVSREELFDKVIGRHYSVFDRTADNHVSSIRKKLGPRVGGVERIRSVRNAGYLYARTPTGTERP